MHNVTLLNVSGFSELRLADVARISTGGDFNALTPREDSDQERLIRACFKAGHLSVFEFADVTFQVECPIFVARQLMRYRCASYIERSLRRCEPLPESDSVLIEAIDEYRRRRGEMKKEDARSVIPVGCQTRFLWKMNLRELCHVFDERLGRGVQAETQEVVKKMFDALEPHFPILLQCWKESKHDN